MYFRGLLTCCSSTIDNLLFSDAVIGGSFFSFVETIICRCLGCGER